MADQDMPHEAVTTHSVAVSREPGDFGGHVGTVIVADGLAGWVRVNVAVSPLDGAVVVDVTTPYADSPPVWDKPVRVSLNQRGLFDGVPE